MKKTTIALHIGVLLFGLAGLFARFLNMPALVITFFRVLISSLFLLVVVVVSKTEYRIEKKKFRYILMAGILLAVHWTTFFQSIQVSTVAIGTIMVSTSPIFTSFLEPIIFKEKFDMGTIVLASMMLLGILIMVPSFTINNTTTLGIIYGVICAIAYSLIGLCNRHLMQSYEVKIVSFYEQFIAMLTLLPFVFFIPFTITTRDVGIVLIQGIIFTAISHSLYTYSLKEVKVQTAGIVSSLEPLYAMIAAYLFFQEIPSSRELFGGIVVLIVVMLATNRTSWLNKK